MLKQLAYCNRCGEHTGTEHEFSIFKDRHSDAAGAMENDYWKFHLCSECKSFVLRSILTCNRSSPQTVVGFQDDFIKLFPFKIEAEIQ